MKVFFTLPWLFLLFACSTPLVSRQADKNRSYTVDFLFEHEGCKVYRFYDRGNYVYFINSSGNVSAATQDSTQARVLSITQEYINE